MIYTIKKYLILKLILIISIMLTVVNYSQKYEEITASDITDAIEIELLLDDYVASHLIDVTTADGIVTLSGSVESLLEKERSTKIAESIKGVRAVVNNISIEPKKISDTELAENINIALLFDPVVSSYDISFDVSDGKVKLKGEVSSWAEMKLASSVVKNVAGVKELQNEIDIVFSTDFTDREIKEVIEKKLELDPYVDESFVSVMVNDGIVKFDGTVGSAAQKTMLMNNAWTAGVKSVNTDDVNILFWADDPLKRESKYIIKSDEEIKNAIDDAMLYDPRVSTFDINVEVESGYVTLDGIVDNLKAKRSAESDATNTIGVVGVKNKIKVRPKIDLEDSDIEKNIEQAFEIDPILNKNKFGITVVNNKAYLSGSVDNYSKKMHASNVASLILGVVDVENNIEVFKEWNYKTDRMIKQDIEDEFFWSFFVDGDDINVTVENGVVTLTGEVQSLQEFRAAIENAFEGGAKRVSSKLDIVTNDDYGYRMYYPNYSLYHYMY